MLLEWNGSIVILLNAMGGSGKSKCSGNSCCVIDFNDWRMNMVGECSQLHIGISATAKFLCLSCKSQQQRESEGTDYVVLLHCIPNHIATHTLFSADRLLPCGIGDGLHGYELLRCGLFGILLRLPPNTSINRISFHSSHYCLHLSSSFQSPLCFSFSPVTAADRSLLLPFQFPLKPSTSVRTTTQSALHLK